MENFQHVQLSNSRFATHCFLCHKIQEYFIILHGYVYICSEFLKDIELNVKYVGEKERSLSVGLKGINSLLKHCKSAKLPQNHKCELSNWLKNGHGSFWNCCCGLGCGHAHRSVVWNSKVTLTHSLTQSHTHSMIKGRYRPTRAADTFYLNPSV